MSTLEAETEAKAEAEKAKKMDEISDGLVNAVFDEARLFGLDANDAIACIRNAAAKAAVIGTPVPKRNNKLWDSHAVAMRDKAREYAENQIPTRDLAAE